MPASVRRYDQTLKTLDLERYVAMYQRKPASRKAPLLPEPLAGMLVAIDGRITNAQAQEGGDDTANPQRIWAFTVDDGSGGVNLVARKAQVLPLLTCMEAGVPVYIVARLRFAHEVGPAETLSTMLGWPRQPDDLVCEVLRAGASEGLDVRADDTPEAHDEDRERQHQEQLAAIAAEGMADAPAPAARKRTAICDPDDDALSKAMSEPEEQTSPTVDLPRVTMKSTDGRTLAEFPPKVGKAPGTTGRDSLLGGPSLAELADGYAGMPYRAIAECCRHAVNRLLLDVHRVGLTADVTVQYSQGSATVTTVRIYGDQVDSGPLLVDAAERWIGGFHAARAVTR